MTTQDIQPTMKIDDRQFQAALRQYMSISSRTLAEILNKKMLRIAFAAHKKTPKADRAQIEQQLGVVGYKFSKSRKTGLFKRRKAITASGALVHRIINARLGRAGKKGLYGKDMKKASQSFLGKRFRVIGTLKAGWLAAIRAFAKATGEAPGVGGIPVKGKSESIIAKDGWNPKAEMAYNVNSFRGQHQAYIDPRVVTALQEGFTDEAQDMQRYCAREMQKVADLFNAVSK